MSYQGMYEIEYNTQIAKDVYEMKLIGNTEQITKSGQFINIKIDGLYLRRPISVCDYGDHYILIIYKVVGEGTKKMSLMKKNDSLDCLVGLGNGFDLECIDGNNVVLVGGGVGVPPMYHLCKELVKRNFSVQVVLGFHAKEDVFYEEEFKELTDNVFISTVVGDYGTKGFVTDVINGLDFDYYMTCGPEPMLRALLKLEQVGQLSFEERMGCGFGACMGCSCKTKDGYKRICVEGPVLLSTEVMMDE